MNIFTRIAWDASWGLRSTCSVFIFPLPVPGPLDPSCRSFLFRALQLSWGSWAPLPTHAPSSRLSPYYGTETTTSPRTPASNSSFGRSFFHTTRWSVLSPSSGRSVKTLVSSWWWEGSCILFRTAWGVPQSRWLAFGTALLISLYHSLCIWATLIIARYSELCLEFAACCARCSFPTPTWSAQYLFRAVCSSL